MAKKPALRHAPIGLDVLVPPRYEYGSTGHNRGLRRARKASKVAKGQQIGAVARQSAHRWKEKDKDMKTALWTKYTALRVVLAVGSLVSLVLASGAGSHWN